MLINYLYTTSVFVVLLYYLLKLYCDNIDYRQLCKHFCCVNVYDDNGVIMMLSLT